MNVTGLTPLSLMDPTLERTLRGHKNYVTSVAFSSTLKQLASGSADNTVMLWNFKPQLRAFRYIGHKGIITSVDFSTEGNLLASGSKDKTVRIWTPNALGESVTLKGHTGAVRSVKFSSDSRHLITGSDDKLAKIWSLPSRKFSCSLVGHSNWVRSAVFNINATLAATGSDDKTVKLWDVSTHQCMHTFHDHNDVVNQVLLHHDGGCLSSASADKSIKVWDLKSRQLIQHYPAHSDSVTSISLHESGFYMLSSSKDSTLKIWDLREGRLLFTLQSHTGPVRSAAFSQDGNFFASGGADQLVMVWKSNLVGVTAPELDWGAKVRQPFSSSTSMQNGEVIKAMNFSPAARKDSIPKQKLKIPDENSKPKENVVSLAGMAHSEDEDQNKSKAIKDSTSAPANNAFVNRDKLPESLAYTLDYIVGQLDIITRTMSLLEQRITATEDRVSNIVAYSRGMVEVPLTKSHEKPAVSRVSHRLGQIDQISTEGAVLIASAQSDRSSSFTESFMEVDLQKSQDSVAKMATAAEYDDYDSGTADEMVESHLQGI